MKTAITLISAVMFFIITQVSAQPTEQWVARYDKGGTDQLYDMTVDAAGNVYVTGASVQVPFTADYLTIKYNSSGVKQWEKSYNSIADSDDRAYAIAVDTSGNVYITGGVTYDNEIVTIKYDSLGNTLWTISYTGPTSGHNWTFAKSIFVDELGYVYVAGTSEGLVGIHGFFQDYTTIKYSPLGVQEWEARYNGLGTDADVVNSMTVDDLGNVYITGFSGGGSTGSGDSYNDITTIKYDSLGGLLWEETYKGPGTSPDEGNMITIDDLGNVYITGKTYTSAANGYDIITIKYNSIGTELWKKFFNGTGSKLDEGIALAVDSMYNVYVTGKSQYGVSNGFDIITIKYDSDGTELWTRNFNGTSNGHDNAEDIKLDAADNIYVLGLSVNTTTSEDYQLIKYDAVGTQLWTIRYTYGNSGGSQELPVALFVDGTYNIYAAGTSALDYAVVKYAETVDIEEVQGQFAVTIFPNPSNGNFTVESQKMDEPMRLNIYDVVGKLIYCSEINNPKYEIDLSLQPNGIYFLTLLNSQTRFITKIIIQH